MRVFAYEPDPLERELLKAMLEHEGYRVSFVPASALAPELRREPGALVIASVAGPEGRAACEALRRECGSPLVALAERLDEELATSLYELGCDEVLARPLRPRLLIARLENLRRRATAPVARAEAEEKITVGPFQLYPARLELRKAGRTIHLTPLQARILYYLMANAGQIVPKSRLEDKVYGCDAALLSNSLKTHICHLRQKLEDDPLAPRVIQTVKGVGYLFQKAAAA